MSPRLSDDEFDLALKPDQKPTPKPPGYWRAVLQMGLLAQSMLVARASDGVLSCGCVHIGNGEWLECHRCVSAEAAEERGLEVCRIIARSLGIGASRYVRAEYFPDYPKGGG